MTAPRETLCPIARQTQALATRLMPLLLVSAALVASPRTSRADSFAAEAMALFNEGVRLRDAGKHDEACAMFVESNRLESTAGRLLNVADCHEREGKIATAWAEFLSASHLYKIRNDDDAVAECQRRASLLEPRLSRLTLRVERPVTSLVVKRNGRVVNAAQFGLPLPVDPGEYVVTAEAPGHTPFRTSTSVGLNHSEQIITVPTLARRPVAVPEKGRSVAGYVVSGFGVAALGVGAAFGMMALSSNAKAEDACPSSYPCEHDTAVAAHDRATTQAWVANVGVGLGMAGLAAGGYMLFLMPRSPQVGSGASQYQSVMFSPQPGGLRVGVRFLKRGVRMSALKKGGHSRVHSRRSDNIGIVSLCALTTTMGCQILGGFDDVPTPSCPPGTVKIVEDGSCVAEGELGGASGYGSAGGGENMAGTSGSGGMQGSAGMGSGPLCRRAEKWETDSGLSGTPFAGGDYTCALSDISNDTEGPVLACWGHNNYGQIAQLTNFNTDAPTPTPAVFEEDACIFSGLPFVSKMGTIVSLGQHHGCATLNFTNLQSQGLSSTNGLFCWGSNSRGQLGAGYLVYQTLDVTFDRIIQSSNFFPKDISDLATGHQHSCVATYSGDVFCWGSNEFGQLGDGIEANFGTQRSNENPIPVRDKDGNILSSASKISSGDDHNCVLTVDAQVWCWGKNDFGQLGRGEVGSSDTPDYLAAPVIGPSGEILRNVIQIAVGGNHSCAIKAEPPEWKSTLLCWGNNKYGQLGQSNKAGTEEPTSTATPVNVPAYYQYQFDMINTVALGASHTCALVGVDGDVFCWGSNKYGQLGRIENFESDLPNAEPKPAEDRGFLPEIALALGSSHSCAVNTDRSIRCWGNNQFGQLGNISYNNQDDEPFSPSASSVEVSNPFCICRESQPPPQSPLTQEAVECLTNTPSLFQSHKGYKQLSSTIDGQRDTTKLSLANH